MHRRPDVASHDQVHPQDQGAAKRRLMSDATSVYLEPLCQRLMGYMYPETGQKELAIWT
jgi:hypothetical protein